MSNRQMHRAQKWYRLTKEVQRIRDYRFQDSFIYNLLWAACDHSIQYLSEGACLPAACHLAFLFSATSSTNKILARLLAAGMELLLPSLNHTGQPRSVMTQCPWNNWRRLSDVSHYTRINKIKILYIWKQNKPSNKVAPTSTLPQPINMFNLILLHVMLINTHKLNFSR